MAGRQGAQQGSLNAAVMPTYPALRCCTGVSHLLEYMAFKTTKTRTHLRLVREVESIGGNVLASGGRRQRGLLHARQQAARHAGAGVGGCRRLPLLAAASMPL
jgi:hypothetical protein